jgi:8-oxo-dGTP pyrophosphatase MutT (NUDIX family)
MSDGAAATKAPVTPLPAATVSLVRDSSRGLEVLMLQRSHSLRFMPGVYVFPGGGLDPVDGAPEMGALCVGLEDPEASSTLGVDSGGLAYWVAAIREAFEEAGILLAYDSTGNLVDMNGKAAARYKTHRNTLDGKGNHAAFGNILRSEGLRLAADRLTYFGHWITPVTVPRRYDTRFFMAVAPERQEAHHDESETIAHRWLKPQEALDARDELGLRFPTIRTLEQFAQCDSTAALARELKGKRVVRPLLPRMTADGRTLLPGEPGYEDAGRVQG